MNIEDIANQIIYIYDMCGNNAYIKMSTDMHISEAEMSSLAFMEFVIQVENTFGVELDDEKIMEISNMTIKELAYEIKNRQVNTV